MRILIHQMTNEQFGRFITLLSPRLHGVDLFEVEGDRASFLLPVDDGSQENTSSLEVINHPGIGRLSVEATVEVDVHGVPEKVALERINEALAGTGMMASEIEDHIHGSRIYIHIRDDVRPDELKERVRQLAEASSTASNVVNGMVSEALSDRIERGEWRTDW